MNALYSWGSPFGAEGVDSFDPSCLSIQAYLQLCKADWQLHHASNTEISPGGCLPALVRDGSAVASGFWRIVETLRKAGVDLDAELDPEQAAQATAYISLVRDGLADALLFSWYLVSENFVGVIRPRLARMFGLPLSLFVPTQLKGHAEQRLKASGVDADSSDLAAPDAGHAPAPLGAKLPRIYLLAKGGFQRHADRSAHPVYQRAAEFLAVLSQKLGNKQFFFGDRPTTLDAVVYGHLWPVIRVELPQDTLRTIVMGKHANLVAHCERVNALLERPVAASTQGVVAGVAAAAKQCIIRYVALPARPLQTAQDNPQCAEEIRSVTGAMLVFLGYVIYNGIVSAPAPRKALADAPLDRPLDAASVLSPLRTT